MQILRLLLPFIRRPKHIKWCKPNDSSRQSPTSGCSSTFLPKTNHRIHTVVYDRVSQCLGCHSLARKRLYSRVREQRPSRICPGDSNAARGGRTIENIDLIGILRAKSISKHPEHPYTVALSQRTRLFLESKTQTHCSFALLLSSSRWWIYLRCSSVALLPPFGHW